MFGRVEVESENARIVKEKRLLEDWEGGGHDGH